MCFAFSFNESMRKAPTIKVVFALGVTMLGAGIMSLVSAMRLSPLLKAASDQRVCHYRAIARPVGIKELQLGDGLGLPSKVASGQHSS